MAAGENIPSRVMPPIMRRYCVFSRTDFVEFVRHVQDVVTEEFGDEVIIEIEADGFETPFEEPESLIQVLTKKEWRKTTELTVIFYSPGDNYHETVELQLGKKDGNNNTIGLKCYIKKGTTSQKIALKENIHRLAEDYVRKPVGIFVAGVITSVSATLVYFLFLEILKYRLNRPTLYHKMVTNNDYVLCIIFGFLLGLIIHSRFIPNIEFVEDTGKTSWDTFSRYFWGFVAIIGIVLAILALI